MKHKDQTGRSVTITGIPNRIVSLVPSQTELLYHLGLITQVVGITKFCVHPEHWFRTKTRVGGTKLVNFKAIDELQPDLVIGNKEENTKSDIETLAEKYPVWLSDVNNLEDAVSMIRSVGTITATTEKADKLAAAIIRAFTDIKPLSPPQRVAYLIWQNPLIAVAADTFIDNMLTHCGYVNIFNHSSRYPETNISELAGLQCDLLMLSSEPFPFNEKHIIEMKEQLPGTQIILVDGEMFSWYGPRLLQSATYFQSLIHKMA